MKPFYLYMLRCADGSYYVGHTDDLEARYAKHVFGTFDGYTAARRPVELVYCCETPTRIEALERERQLKGWSRAKKEALVRGAWDRIHELARCRAALRLAASRLAQGKREKHHAGTEEDHASMEGDHAGTEGHHAGTEGHRAGTEGHRAGMEGHHAGGG